MAVVAAVFLSNVPESLSAATGLRETMSPRRILLLWAAVALVSTLASAVGYAALGDASPDTTATIQSFAAGAILTMLADTMVPEAFDAENRSPLHRGRDDARVHAGRAAEHLLEPGRQGPPRGRLKPKADADDTASAKAKPEAKSTAPSGTTGSA